jgi:ferredoxin-NADP reductase
MLVVKRRKMAAKRLLAPFITPVQYDFWARQFGSTSAWKRCFARVLSRVQEADDAITFRLAPNSNFGGFVAGQHVNLTATINGCRVTRSYSFSSIPNDKSWVEFTVRRDAAGLMSSWLFENAKVGTVLELEASFGGMTAALFTEQPIVLLAAGIGITPLMSLLREQVALGMPRSITLVYWARTENLLCFQQEIKAIACKFKNFTVHTVFTSKGTDQRISEKLLNTLGVQLKKSQVLACGGNEFVKQARKNTAAAHSFQAEAFTPPKRILDDATEQKYTIELLGGRSVEVSNQQTLLDALEQHNVPVSAGCRMGICNTCSCTKTSGATQNIDSRVTDVDSNTQVRLCVTRAASNLQLAI